MTYETNTVRRVLALAGATALLLTLAVAAGQPSAASLSSVIVLERDHTSDEAERAVRAAGGEVGASLPLVGGFAARVPAGVLPTTPAIKGLLPDAIFRLDARPGGGGKGGPTVRSTFVNAVDAPKAWSAGFKGSTAASIAILDSGISPSPDFTSPANRIVGWVDFVSGSASPIDPHGHGSYLAGIAAGNGSRSSGAYQGIAPGAGLVGVRVFDALGVTTSSRIIQGIQWAIANKSAHSIRVITMAFSTNSDLSYRFDAVAYAAEQAWKAGIAVVASAGNAGPLPGSVLSPGNDPFVITVGAVDDRGTSSRIDDLMASWSGAGPTLIDGHAKPDLVAPGVWDTGVRVPGSTVDLQHPLSVRDTWYFDGSGTSPATAVAAGTIALMLQRRPSLSPDQVKYALRSSATAAPLGPNSGGAGYVNAYAATMSKATARANGGLAWSIGGGLLSLTGVPDVKWR